MSSNESLPKVDNTKWSSFKKLWISLKIIRKKASTEKDQEIISKLKEEEIEISRKIVEIAPFLTNGKGEHITIPMFPLLGNKT